ncbi:MAG TPA: transcriptional regulator [Deltaproteobacteria bacterium]|nr:transcriptional regulator [Deltaproteobacteria bacterium]
MKTGVKIIAPADIGRIIRKKRKEDGLSLAEAAALCNVGYRFLSDLENGKATVHLNKVLQVLKGLGIDLWLGAGKDND